MTTINIDSITEMEKNNNALLNANDVLGLQYSTFRKSLYALSLSKPSEYYKLQEDVTQQIKKKLVTTLYKDTYELLRFGRIDTVSIMPIGIPAPDVPSLKVNESAMSITSTINSFVDEILELILPKSFLSLADNRLRVQSEINI